MAMLLGITSLLFLLSSCKNVPETSSSESAESRTESSSTDSQNEADHEQRLVLERIKFIVDNLSVGMTRDKAVATFGEPSKKTKDFLVYLVWDPDADPSRSGDYGVTIYLENGRVSQWAGMGVLPTSGD